MFAFLICVCVFFLIIESKEGRKKSEMVSLRENVYRYKRKSRWQLFTHELIDIYTGFFKDIRKSTTDDPTFICYCFVICSN